MAVQGGLGVYPDERFRIDVEQAVRGEPGDVLGRVAVPGEDVVGQVEQCARGRVEAAGDQDSGEPHVRGQSFKRSRRSAMAARSRP
ncbi:hypothetical protein BC793_108185 [Actinoplanes xinjiangensis]|uniref:Uncharacterized protein n=1 Tax=Actinoplanes xinjiangensis TaxID=512350 RepID=A0A316FH14_9ACTN|nr:hypothetical protein BC793_108185 [Actinoplanes xinjiangensis]